MASLPIPYFDYQPKMGIPGLYSLEFNASGRFEEFLNNSTNVLVPRIGIRWQPFDEELTIRATWGEGFIEPSLASLYGAPVFILASTNLNGVTRSPETTQELDSNRNLQPEDSRNFSAGFVYTPKWIHNWESHSSLTLSVDFWDVERSGVVTVQIAQEVVNQLGFWSKIGSPKSGSGCRSYDRPGVTFVKYGFP